MGRAGGEQAELRKVLILFILTGSKKTKPEEMMKLAINGTVCTVWMVQTTVRVEYSVRTIQYCAVTVRTHTIYCISS